MIFGIIRTFADELLFCFDECFRESCLFIAVWCDAVVT
jgi:hypothetical protein